MFRVLLGIFAALLFTAAAQAQSSYRIKSGDTLNVEVLEDSTLNRSTLVLPDGSISFPLAGSVPAGGRTVDQVRSDLTQKLSSTFASPPTVFVSVGAVGVRPAAAVSAAPATRAIYVTGEIANPGKLDATRGTTLLQAIAQAGGLTRFAADKRIQLRRGDKIFLYNFRTNGGGLSGNTVLVPGDVIVVPQRRLFE
ncbi:polysaccharide export protein [Leisingera aquaemixtae]|uniref:polysaccharide biosynthesis/export family protein n=1 Tax=Leisingera TaxID=191028 RepID=UPI001C94BFCB|nr:MULTISPECIES: polysaccharide biosynthesis/export family protein [Leisingera]MBY6069006.1 polysaccharide export protein [Leisingera aquaemixtae]MCB4458561.1 polysaccharide export protein [Leisingera sp. McT4-56]